MIHEKDNTECINLVNNLEEKSSILIGILKVC